MGRVNVGIENQHPGRAKTLRRHAPAETRMTGVIKLFSKAYLTKKTTPRKKASPPIQANSFTPTIDSQSNAGTGNRGGMLWAGNGGGRTTVGTGACEIALGIGGGGAGAGEGTPPRFSSSRRRRRRSSTRDFISPNCAA